MSGRNRGLQDISCIIDNCKPIRKEAEVCKKNVCIEPYVLFHHFSSTLMLSGECERMALL